MAKPNQDAIEAGMALFVPESPAANARVLQRVTLVVEAAEPHIRKAVLAEVRENKTAIEWLARRLSTMQHGSRAFDQYRTVREGNETHAREIIAALLDAAFPEEGEDRG